jgi:hypothetical protein
MLEVPVVRLRNSFYFILKRWLIKNSLSVTWSITYECL